MRLKKLINIIIFVLLIVLMFYFGGCFLGTFTKALTQPHLEGMGRTWNFMGFYIMAGFYAIIFVALAAILGFLIIRKRKAERTKNRG